MSLKRLDMPGERDDKQRDRLHLPLHFHGGVVQLLPGGRLLLRQNK
jgi:hypothetical protein